MLPTSSCVTYLAQRAQRTRRHAIISHRGRRGRGESHYLAQRTEVTEACHYLAQRTQRARRIPDSCTAAACCVSISRLLRLGAENPRYLYSRSLLRLNKQQAAAGRGGNRHFLLYFTLPTSCFLLHFHASYFPSSPSSLLSWSPRHCSRTGHSWRTCYCRGFGCGARIRWGSRIGCSARIGHSACHCRSLRLCRGFGCGTGDGGGSRCGRGGGWGICNNWGTGATNHGRNNMGQTITQPEFSVSIVTPAVRNPIGSESTRVTCACIDVDKRGSCGCHRQHWDEPISGSTVTNLPIILPPTVGDTATGQGTGVTPARANAAKRNSRRQRH